MADGSRSADEAGRDLLVLGRTVRALRKRAGMTQEELAARASTMSNYLSLVENGKRGLRWPMVMRLLRAMGVSASEFGAEIDEQSRR